MTTKVEKSIKVKVPVSTAYNQWTQFEDFPQFMGGITSVTQTSEDLLHWVAQIAGVKREWDARVLEQVPDHKVAWAATTGATNAGHVLFEPGKKDTTKVTLHLEYEPQGLVEKVGDKVGFVGNQAKSDLKKFKKFIEAQGYASGAWRGTVNPGAGIGTPGIEHAAGSVGDSGKAGVSPTTIAGVLALTAGIGAGIAATVRAKSNSTPTPASGVSAPVELSSHRAAEAAPAQAAPAVVLPAEVAPTQVAPTQVAPVQAVPASTGIDAPATGLYENTAEPHVLSDEDIAERTPDVPQAYAESDSASHEHGDTTTDGDRA